MEKPIETQLYKHHKIEIFYDTDFSNDSPRDWDNLGTMVCKHPKYSLGDKNNEFDQIGCNDMATLKDYILKTCDPVVILPIYLLDHSGLKLNTSSFSDSWDTGQIGFIFARKGKVLKEFNWKKITSKRTEKIKNILELEIKTYNQFLEGDIYGFVVSGPLCEDSCWSIYGIDAAIEMAKSNIDFVTKIEIKSIKETSKLKGLKNYVILSN